MLGAEIQVTKSETSASHLQRLFWLLRVMMGLFIGAVVLSEYGGPGGEG